jgi:heavy metal translocating P-type ATPase
VAGRFCCIGCRIARELSRPAEAAGGAPGGTLLLRLGLGIFLTLNIMAFNGPLWSRDLFGSAGAGAEHVALVELFAYLQLCLCTVVLALLGTPFVADALGGRLGPAARGSAWAPRLDGDLLIALGVGSAWLLSVARTLRGEGGLYFDTAAVLLVLLTLGRYLEARVRRRAADSAGTLLAAAGARATVERDAGWVEVAADAARVGDRMLVRGGETILADGVVIEGTSRLDESSLTGESRPREIAPAGRVLAGTLNLDGRLCVLVERTGDDRVIAGIRRLLDEARRRPPRIQRVIDRVARWLVPAVAALALAVFGVHAARGDALRGLMDALSVLLASCPCALGLAAPLACWSALGRAAARGIVVDSCRTLESAALIRRVFFDKTGTLTAAEPEVVRIASRPDVDWRDALAQAAALETGALHPVARGILRRAGSLGLDPPQASAVRTLPGVGVEGRVGERTLQLGGERVVARGADALETAWRHDGEDEAGKEAWIAVWLVESGRALARFELAERVRDDAAPTIAALERAGLEVGVLTGDAAGPARRLAARLGIAVEHSLLPGDKVERIDRARRGRGTVGVAMVGDGLNDAPVLAAADVGFAIATATDVTRHAGRVRLIHDRLAAIPEALALARHCRRRIRLALGWAFAYNAVAVSLAATGRLAPVAAAAAMVASSLTVIALAAGAGRPAATPASRSTASPATAATPVGARVLASP